MISWICRTYWPPAALCDRKERRNATEDENRNIAKCELQKPFTFVVFFYFLGFSFLVILVWLMIARIRSRIHWNVSDLFFPRRVFFLLVAQTYIFDQRQHIVTWRLRSSNIYAIWIEVRMKYTRSRIVSPVYRANGVVDVEWDTSLRCAWFYWHCLAKQTPKMYEKHPNEKPISSTWIMPLAKNG